MYQPASIVALTDTVTFAPGAMLSSSISALQWTGSWAWALPVTSAAETASAGTSVTSDLLFDIISRLLYGFPYDPYGFLYESCDFMHHSIPNFFSSSRKIGIETPNLEKALAILPSGSMM